LTINQKARPCDEATIRSTRAVANCAASAKPWVLLAAILASSISYVDESVVNVALPAIETDLATSVVVVQWLVNAYTLCLSAFLLIGGLPAIFSVVAAYSLRASRSLPLRQCGAASLRTSLN
jgi:MFS family permease